jgi:hypothetical protein
MLCLMLLSSRRYISELMLTKGARISRSPNKPKGRKLSRSDYALV